MSTTYSATATKDKDSTDKDSTSTYVRSSDTSDTITGKSTIGKNKSSNDSDKTQAHDSDINSSQYRTSSGITGQFGQSGSQQSRGQQYGQEFDSQQGKGFQSQNDVQQKLKEVGNLLQKAGHLLQDLQGFSGEFQIPSMSRGYGGNYSGPYGGGFESTSHGISSGQHQWSGRMDRPMQFTGDMDREDRGFSGRGYSSRPEERFELSRQGGLERGSSDRFGGFGGPNRPDMAYGQQYGGRGGNLGSERRGGELEFGRRGGVDRY